MPSMRPVEIGGVIAQPTQLACVWATQHTPALVPDCGRMTNGPFIAAHFTTRALAKWFPFGNNFTLGFH
jgi:hypothetical protein